MGDHWYSRDGSPCYEVPTADGKKQRNTDLRDARKLGLVPSVTTVLQVLDKPALTNWKVDQGIMAALTLPRHADESEAAWLMRVKEDSKAQALAAAEEGTRIHDACERALKGQSVIADYLPHVAAVRAELARLFPLIDDWIPEQSFSHCDGFGGKVDLHSPSTGIVVDYKGKDGDFTDGKKLAYDQNYQLGAYQHGLCLQAAVCVNIFVSRTHPGKVASHIWTPEESAYGRDVFLDALRLWKRLKKFDSGYTLQLAA